jgi:probable selenium-dependent hydroxylase accessory protein YqeC
MTTLRQGLMLGDGGVVSLVGAGGKTSLMFRLARELAEGGQTVLTTSTTKIFAPSADQAAQLILAPSATGLMAQARKLLQNQPHICAAAARLPGQGKLGGFLPEVIEELSKSGLFRWIIVEADGAARRPLKVPADHEPVIPAATTCLVGVLGLNGVGQPLDEQRVFRLQQFVELTGLERGAIVTETAVTHVLTDKKGIFKGAPEEAERIVFCNQADIPCNLAAGRRIAQNLLKTENTGIKRVVIGQAQCDPPVLEVYDLNAQSGYDD